MHRNFMAISQTIWLNCVVAVKTMMTIRKLHRSTLKRQIYQNIIFPAVICQIRERKRKILIDFEAASSISSATGWSRVQLLMYFNVLNYFLFDTAQFFCSVRLIMYQFLVLIDLQLEKTCAIYKPQTIFQPN